MTNRLQVTATAIAPVAVLLAGSLAGCQTVVTGTAETATPTADNAAPLVKASALPSLIPPLDAIAAIANAASPFALAGSYNQPQPIPVADFSDPNCVAALFTAADVAFNGSGFTAMYGQTTGNVAANFDHRAEQAVVAFSDADKALQFADNQVGSWKSCAGKTIHMQVDGNPVSWTVGALSEVNALPVLFRTQEGGNGFACAHTMTARVNIVIDAEICSVDTAAVVGQAAALATAIADRIPT